MSAHDTVFQESGKAHRQSTTAQPSIPRMLFIDNLHWTMIILVISMHAAPTFYSNPVRTASITSWKTRSMSQPRSVWSRP